MVVVLLVLLALIGTAFVATARIDRSAAGQNTANTQIDLLLQGAENMANAILIDNLFGPGGAYRPTGPVVAGPTGYQNPGYTHQTGYDTGYPGSVPFEYPNDAWLAARTPLRPSDIGAVGNNPVCRSSISRRAAPQWHRRREQLPLSVR